MLTFLIKKRITNIQARQNYMNWASCPIQATTNNDVPKIIRWNRRYSREMLNVSCKFVPIQWFSLFPATTLFAINVWCFVGTYDSLTAPQCVTWVLSCVTSAAVTKDLTCHKMAHMWRFINGRIFLWENYK